MFYKIPLWVKSTFTDDEGTEIVPREDFPGRRATGVTHTGKLVYLQFDLKEAEDEHRIQLEGRIYETLARYGVNLFMLIVSPTSTGFAVPRSQYSIVQDVFDGLVVPFGKSFYIGQIGDHPSLEV